MPLNSILKYSVGIFRVVWPYSATLAAVPNNGIMVYSLIVNFKFVSIDDLDLPIHCIATSHTPSGMVTCIQRLSMCQSTQAGSKNTLPLFAATRELRYLYCKHPPSSYAPNDPESHPDGELKR